MFQRWPETVSLVSLSLFLDCFADVSRRVLKHHLARGLASPNIAFAADAAEMFPVGHFRFHCGYLLGRVLINRGR